MEYEDPGRGPTCRPSRGPQSAKMACTGSQILKTFGNNMFSRNLSALLRYSQSNKFVNYRAFSSKHSETENEADPAPLFFNQEVQRLLKTLTRVDLKKVFRKRREGQPLQPPVYQFMTDEEVENAMAEANVKAEQRLQMPPVVKKRPEIKSVLSKDPALQGYDTSNYLFTDITYGISDYDRIMVVREPDGTLRHAGWEERQRLNQIYFPMPGREIGTPKMFEQEFLMDLLNRHEYEFVLDHACVQFEPNDPEFHRVTEAVYSHVNKKKHFEHLRSTRHFGPLAFHLAWNKNIDNFLLENIHTGRIEDAALLIQVYYKIHPTVESVEVKFEGDNMKLIEAYVNLDSPMKSKLEQAIQAYKELEKEKRMVAEGIQRAHGLQ